MWIHWTQKLDWPAARMLPVVKIWKLKTCRSAHADRYDDLTVHKKGVNLITMRNTQSPVFILVL